MTFSGDKRAARTAGTAIALCLLAMPAVALTPLPPCETVESGMRVSDGQSFGYYGSGFVTEEYSNAVEADAGADGVFDQLPAPLPQLQGFYGYRVTDCKSGEFLAVDDFGKSSEHLLATEFLRSKVQQEKPFTMADVRRAAAALYKGQDIQMLTLRETEQTCACKEFGGQ